MKTTGITRRMDELGRIVIPKEIRKSMHIKSGELLEISLDSLNEIKLKKYSFINKDQSLINELIVNISNIIGCDIILLNTSEIIFSTNDKYSGDLLLENIENEVNLVENNMHLKITNKVSIKQPYSIYKIVPNGDLEGYIIFDFKQIIDTNDKVLVDFLVTFLNSYFESK